MTSPSTAGFAVETVKLLDEARLWEEQALAMQDIGTKIDAVRFGDPGIYALFVSGYHDLIDALVARCVEAVDRMGEIRGTLGHIANLYEATEERHAQQLGPANP